MTNYERLLVKAEKLGIRVKEVDFNTNKECGFYSNNKILINRNLSDVQKYGVLAEELGHHFMTVGDISDQNNINNIQQELKARRKGYSIILEPIDLVYAFRSGAKNLYEIADFLDVTPEVLNNAIYDFKVKYGPGKQFGNYYIKFEPVFGFCKLIKY